MAGGRKGAGAGGGCWSPFIGERHVHQHDSDVRHVGGCCRCRGSACCGFRAPGGRGLSATQARAAVRCRPAPEIIPDEQAPTLCDLATSFEAGIVNWQDGAAPGALTGVPARRRARRLRRPPAIFSVPIPVRHHLGDASQRTMGPAALDRNVASGSTRKPPAETSSDMRLKDKVAGHGCWPGHGTRDRAAFRRRRGDRGGDGSQRRRPRRRWWRQRRGDADQHRRQRRGECRIRRDRRAAGSGRRAGQQRRRGVGRRLADIADDTWARVIGVNLNGAFYCAWPPCGR